MTATTRLAATTAIVGFVLATVVAGQTQPSRIIGRVTDGSGAALPGVAVTIAPTGPTAPVSVVTDGVGQYVSPALAPDTYTVTFELSGFEPRTSSAVAIRDGDVLILDRQLDLASLEEKVEVVASAPAPPLRLSRPEPPKRPQAAPVPREVLATVCGPTQPTGTSVALGHIAGLRSDRGRELFGDGDVLLLDIGADAGVTPGQNLVVRRQFRVGDKALPLKQASFGEGAAGLIQVVETSPDTSVAVVVYACGEMFTGDSVEPFDALPMWTALEGGTPRFDEPAHVILGDQGKIMGAPQDLMVIDRGTLQGAQRGQRLTIFRKAADKAGPAMTIADAIIVAVRPESATVRIERASDAVTVGDLVALHR